MTPYATIPGRVLLYLQDRCPSGGTIQIGVRAMATAIGCSAGSISPAYATLEADGYIRRIPGGGGSLIEVLSPDQMTDRPIPDQSSDRLAQSDQSADRARAKSTAVRSRVPRRDETDQSTDRARARRDTSQQEATKDVRTLNQVKMACMDHDHVKQHEQHDPRTCDSISCDQNHPQSPQPPPGFFDGAWCALLQIGYDHRQAEQDIATLRQRGYEREAAIGIIVRARRKGEPIYARGYSNGQGASHTGHHRPNGDESTAGRDHCSSGGGRGGRGAGERAGGGAPHNWAQRPRRVDAGYSAEYWANGGWERDTERRRMGLDDPIVAELIRQRQREERLRGV